MTDRSESAETDVAEAGDASGELGGEEAEEHDADDSGHLADVEDGAGCTEIWERLSERREAERSEAETDETRRRE
ncbi:hypothetical protein [Halorubrum depositum]|uniref:hypothetical protein n=1 Tax=Halorubrum depositum TaxID=2583992 RepID=UPI0011A28B87|nr:hypothetical protein [Halorubrum depositum]